MTLVKPLAAAAFWFPITIQSNLLLMLFSSRFKFVQVVAVKHNSLQFCKYGVASK